MVELAPSLGMVLDLAMVLVLLTYVSRPMRRISVGYGVGLSLGMVLEHRLVMELGYL